MLLLAKGIVVVIDDDVVVLTTVLASVVTTIEDDEAEAIEVVIGSEQPTVNKTSFEVMVIAYLVQI